MANQTTAVELTTGAALRLNADPPVLDTDVRLPPRQSAEADRTEICCLVLVQQSTQHVHYLQMTPGAVDVLAQLVSAPGMLEGYRDRDNRNSLPLVRIMMDRNGLVSEGDMLVPDLDGDELELAHAPQQPLMGACTEEHAMCVTDAPYARHLFTCFAE